MIWLATALYALGVPLGTLLYDAWATKFDKDSLPMLLFCTLFWPVLAVGVWYGILRALGADLSWRLGWAWGWVKRKAK